MKSFTPELIVKHYQAMIRNSGIDASIQIERSPQDNHFHLRIMFVGFPAIMIIDVDTAELEKGKDYFAEFLAHLYGKNPDYAMAMKFKEVMKWAVK